MYWPVEILNHWELANSLNVGLSRIKHCNGNPFFNHELCIKAAAQSPIRDDEIFPISFLGNRTKWFLHHKCVKN